MAITLTVTAKGKAIETLFGSLPNPGRPISLEDIQRAMDEGWSRT